MRSLYLGYLCVGISSCFGINTLDTADDDFPARGMLTDMDTGSAVADTFRSR